MYEVNKELVARMLDEMPPAKKESLRKSLTRNSMLTSYYGLSFGTLSVYKEGFYLEFSGTRCAFSVYAQDDDGELRFTRKPNDRNLSLLYRESIYDTLSFIDWNRY